MQVRGRELSATQRALFADIAEFDRSEAWRGDGAVSMVAWLTERCGVSGATARVWVRAAAQLESLPHLAGALSDGTLSLDAVAPLADVATPETDAVLAEASVHWSVKQVRELAASHRGTTDAVAARRFEHRSLRFNDAKSTIWAAFAQDDYAVAKAALIGLVSWSGSGTPASSGSQGGAGVGSADPLGYVPFDQRLCDAFMEMCRGIGRSPIGASAASGADGREGAKGGSGAMREDRDPSGERGRYRPTVVVHADLGFLTGSHPNGVAELAGIGPISTEVARRLACDAKVVFSVERGDGCILDQKRVRRSPTMAQRIEIARRDKGCRFASCGFVDFTEVHHMVHWVRGGETNLSNLITLCGRHHRAVHELGWTMDGSADGVVTFEGPHGYRMTSAPSPTWRRAGSSPMLR
ncbi:MAG: DUF222 domain-containing protein [Acidimicrobiales bacterium]|jgi:hypothetical protein